MRRALLAGEAAQPCCGPGRGWETLRGETPPGKHRASDQPKPTEDGEVAGLSLRQSPRGRPLPRERGR